MECSVHTIGLGSQVYGSFLGELPASHGDTFDDEHNFSSSKGQSVIEDHPDVRGHATNMCSGSQGYLGREEHLPLEEFAHNNSYQESIQMVPYEALYGRPCRSPVC